MRHLPKFFFVLVVWISSAVKAQQLSPIMMLGDSSMNLNEPCIAINPKQPKEVIIATNKFHVFISTQHGNKWTHKTINSSMGIYGDPVVLYDHQGHGYYAHLAKAKDKKRPEWFDQIVVQKSLKNIRTWNDGVGVGKNGKMQDKPWLCFDEVDGSPYKHTLYLTWTEFDAYGSSAAKDSSRIRLAKSTNFARSFSNPITISDQSGTCLDDDNTLEGATVAVGPHGHLYAAWAGREKIYMDKSTDGGQTWGRDQIVADIPKGWDLSLDYWKRINGLPFISAISDSELTITAAYEDKGYHRVGVWMSHDSGLTWSDALPLQEEKETHYVMPHGYADPGTGNYYILYYKIKDNKVDVLLSYKLKGENRFKTIQVTDTSFTIPTPQPFTGDYINVHALKNNVVMAWTEMLDSHSLVKVRLMKLNDD